MSSRTAALPQRERDEIEPCGGEERRRMEESRERGREEKREGTEEERLFGDAAAVAHGAWCGNNCTTNAPTDRRCEMRRDTIEASSGAGRVLPTPDQVLLIKGGSPRGRPARRVTRRGALGLASQLLSLCGGGAGRNTPPSHILVNLTGRAGRLPAARESLL